MTLQEKIGAAIVQLRQAQGVSQEKLALEAEIGRRYMSDIENGKRNLSLDILVRIAQYFHMPLSQLIDRAESIDRKKPTLDNIKEWLVEHEAEGAVVLENPDYISAILGVTDDGRVVYSYEGMVEDLVETEGMDYDEAADFVSYNTLRALPYMGEKAPIIINENPYK